jgi:selenoprotein W-related protein
MSAANDILARYQHILRSLTLTNGSTGAFDVAIDGNIIYSKAETGRHAEPGEVLDLFVEHYAQGKTLYGQN